MALILKRDCRSGTREWLFQRLSNLLICVWSVVFISLFISAPQLNYESWVQLFSPLWFKLYSSSTLLIVCLNSVLAGWQIGTDYIKANAVNWVYMQFIRLVSLLYAVLGLFILWGLT
ncbi:succinate dehydrogenase, hydrophobic membrane anchor protein [Marinomonas mediterranea]|uniref:succinate dehydrogenase, hydrophobic membrane anchor protein n=1 Tax=Marinomonas mediterranea TaxID=119864 RepID=UPI00234BFF21|nr:succinate dehydrogenase, hydrophobic membrane anchor protein [Marinomonas mediterranea]WCN07614.1 succinate dehydrogenase, hydrophobic membrane anchor protein [Marinomonas mediterranea]